MLRACVMLACLGIAAPVFAQRTDGPPRPPRCGPQATSRYCTTARRAPKTKTFDINPLELDARVRTLSILGFLERANEELERSSLETKSFLPRMVKSVDDEAL